MYYQDDIFSVYKFQFLIGSLEAYRPRGLSRDANSFQFLIGNLEAVPKLTRALSLLFQFLIGTLDAL